MTETLSLRIPSTVFHFSLLIITYNYDNRISGSQKIISCNNLSHQARYRGYIINNILEALQASTATLYNICTPIILSPYQ